MLNITPLTLVTIKSTILKRGSQRRRTPALWQGLTKICNVHGYVLNEHEREPIDGKLIYRGIDIEDLIAGFTKGGRYGFEETIYLLLFGGSSQ